MTGRNKITLRPAREEEAEALSRLAFASKAHWGYDAAFMEACREELRVSAADIARYNVLVAECAGQRLGYGYLSPREVGGLEIQHLFVAPEAMGQGAGRALTEALIAQARTAGEPQLWAEADPNAAAFYQACGFRQVGAVPSGSIGGRSLPLMVLDI